MSKPRSRTVRTGPAARSLVLTTAAIALAATVSAPIHAQESAPAADESDEGLAPIDEGLAPIIVTARKREESLLDTPLSVTALTSEEILERGIRDISEVALVTPGFSMQNIQAGTEQPFIRGMATTSFERTLQTSSTFIDGNYFSVLGRTAFFPDIERVEVVRGPQAALFGRATFAGAINFITKGPTAEPGGEVRMELGEHGRLNAHGALSGPIAGDVLLGRISATSEIFGGEYRNLLDNQLTGQTNHKGLTAALRLVPSNDVTIDLKGFRTWFRDLGQVPEYIQGAATLNCFPNTAGVPTYFCGELVPDPQQVKLNLNLVGNGFQNLDQTRGILNADWRFGNGMSLTATTTYAKQQSETFCDCDYSGSVSFGGAFHSLFAGEIENKSQELRLQSDTGPLRWMVGGYVFAEESNSFRANAATIVIPFVTVNNKAVFGSVEFDLTPQLTVNLDGRYQRERQTRSAIPGNPAIDVIYKAFLPRAIVEFKPNDAMMLYASVAKGNQPGQFNTGSNIPADLVKVDSESLWSYEAGVKAELLDRRLRFALAGYRVDWSNQVYRTERVGTDGRIINILANLGASRINGLEFEAAASLAPGLTLTSTFAFIDSRYRDFLSPNALRVYRNAQVAGRRLPNTPRYQGSLSLAYERPVSADTELFVRGDYSYRARQFVSEINQAYIDDLHLVNLSAGVETEGLRFTLRVDNLLNSDVPEFATRFTDLNSPGLSRFGYLIKLRSSRAVSASLRYAF